MGLVTPAGPVTEERIEAALAHCRQLDLEPVPGQFIRSRTGFLAGPDRERLADLTEMLEDPSIDAVWAIRGGYGTMRLLAHLPERVRPRAYIGFSDNTALHLWLLGAGAVPFHGPHAGGDYPPLADACFRQVLFHPGAAGVLPAGSAPVRTLRGGRVEGPLLGGNLSLLAALCGTRWQPDARGCVLFVEEIGEAGYRVDRMFRQLELAGALAGVVGLAMGQFTDCGTEEDTAQVEAVLLEWSERLAVPAVQGLPIGHVPENWTLPLGVRAELDADAGTLALLEPAVEGW